MAKLLSNTRVYGTATVDTRLFVNGFISSNSTNSGSLQVSGGVGVSGGGFFGGTVTATNFVGAISGTASLATDLAGGTAGQLLYQITANDTGFVGPGTSGQILISAGTSSPTYVNTETFAVGLSKNLLGGTANQFAYQTAANATAFISTGSMYVGRAVLADALSTGGISTATNLANGTTGQVPYQSAPGVTNFFGPGTAGQLLVSQGANAAGPVFTNTSSIYVKDSDISTNLRSGTAGQVPYQTGVGTTNFFGPGTAGQVLTSGGVSGPIYVNTSSLYVGRAVIADSASGTDTADKIKTIARPDAGAHYLTFVDSNNAASTGELLYTTSTAVVNPATGYVGLGTSSPSERLELLSTADTARIKITNSTAGRSSILGHGGSGFYWQPTNNGDVFELRNASGTGLFVLNPNTQYVGIGTTGPSERLHVDGGAVDTRIRVSANDGTNLRGFEVRAGSTFKGAMFYRSTEGNVIQIWGPNTTSASMYVDSNNFVGIGTSGPAYTLDVRGSLGAGGGGTNFVVTSDNDGMTRIGTSLAGTGASRLNIQDRLNWYESFYVGTTLKARLGVGSGDDLAWEVGGTERVRFTGTGNVGIGVTPLYKFHVDTTSEWGIVQRYANDTTTNRGTVFLGLRARGSIASPTTVTSGTILGGVAAGGYNGTSYTQGWNGGGEIYFVASESWTSTAEGTDLYFRTTPNGTGTPQDAMILTQSGRLGIGTTSPAVDVHISKATNTALRLHATGGGGSAELDLLSNGAQNAFIDFGPNDLRFRSTNADMSAINNQSVLVLSNAGNVGIATTSPATLLDISFNGASNYGVAARFHQSAIGNSDGPRIEFRKTMTSSKSWGVGILNGVDVGTFTISEDNIHSTGFGTSRFAIAAGGDIGIGTTTPISPFGGRNVHIRSTSGMAYLTISGAVNEESLINLTGNDGTTNTGVLQLRFRDQQKDAIIGVVGNPGSANTASLSFNSGNFTQAMVIAYGGNVGIGTNTPTQKLHIYTGNPASATTLSTNSAIAVDSSGNQYLEFRTTAASSGIMQGLLFTDNGKNAFIGYKEYSGAVAGTYGESIHLGLTDYSGSDTGSGIYFGTTTNAENGVTNPLMFIRSNGNVGINTTGPSFRLDVNGSARASSDFRAPIFYDTDNTGYFIDAFSTSILNNLYINGQKNFTPLASAYIAARGTGLNNNANRYVAVNSTVVVNDTTRGLTLTILNGSATSFTTVSSTNYDTYGDGTASNNLATAINNMTSAQIGILTSYDAWELNVTDNLRAAALKHGLNKLATYRAGGSRRPYAAIFYGTSDTTNASTKDAIERMESDDADAPRALITTYLTTDGATAAIDGAYSVNALYSSNSTIEDPIVVVSSDGNVGIGTTNPTSNLVLAGGSYRRFDIIASQQPSIYLDSGGGDIEWYNSYGTVGMLFQSQEQSPNWSTQMIYFNGYGTYATRKLEFLDTKLVVTTTGRTGVNISSPEANLHVNAATPSGAGAAPSGTTGIFDSNTNNYLTFRNTADNGTYSGIAFQDNNVGGYVIFGNAGGGGDQLWIAGYNGGSLQTGTANSIDRTARTTVASWGSGNFTLSGAGLFVNRQSFGTAGISYYSSGFTSWCTYMAPAGSVAQGPTGNINAPSGVYVTSWALRNFIENAGNYGFTWESGTATGQPSVIAELRTSDGLFHTWGNIYKYNSPSGGYMVPAISISDSAPTGTVNPGDLWWESDTGRLKIRYNDGTTTQWVDATAVPDLSTFYSKAGGVITGPVVMNSTLTVNGAIRADNKFTVGSFPNSTTNNNEAWFGRASDRGIGTMTVQLGVANTTNFEVVDYAWTTVIFNAGMNSLTYRGRTIPTVSLQDSAPSGVKDGDFWWESDTGKLKIRYNDGSSAQWVDVLPIPDMSTYFSKGGGGINGSVTIDGTLLVTGKIFTQDTLTQNYSDERLKTVHGRIEDAVNKVCQIGGYYYSANEEAAKYGYTDQTEKVGVLAQEVEKVLPHAISRAPFDIEKNEQGEEISKSGQEYKAVHYETLVPLLIEAIKEQQQQINDLKKEIKTLRGKN